MALFLADEELDALAERAQKTLNAPTKKDAVRQALERVVKDEAATHSGSNDTLAERVKKIQSEVKRLGTPNPNFDDKAFLDDMWEI
jgi:antitoxin VapB